MRTRPSADGLGVTGQARASSLALSADWLDTFRIVPGGGSGEVVPQSSQVALPSEVARRHSDAAHAQSNSLLRTRSVADGAGVSGSAWRMSTVLQDEYWRCSQCDIAFPNAATTCSVCGQQSALELSSYNEDVQSRTVQAHDSSYGRRLRFLANREQHNGDIASLGHFDDPNYDSLVQQSVNDVGVALTPSERSDFMAEGVRHFHAFVQIVTKGKHGFSSEEDTW